ncbi:DUF1285 domain-containing protein [Shimia sp.]|uniref:DUF1285 domain-containing protein n=1 Tax=Shimia sp. TaxID=1954381 RepID=UPI003569CE11
MSGHFPVKPDPEGIASAARAAQGDKGLPPVHLWNPASSGKIDMRIARDGSWHYQGSPITRPRMVRLFSTILRRDGDHYVLVTPVEKVEIEVEDVPFVAVDLEVRGAGADQVLCFLTNVGDRVEAGAEAPIRVAHDPETGAPAPYVRVRGNLEARIDRKSFYRMVELGEEGMHQGQSWFGLRSGGVFFPIQPLADLA